MKFLMKIDESGTILRVDIQDVERYSKYLLTNKGTDGELVLRKRTKWSSPKQRKYYWGGILGTLGDEIGYNSDNKADMMELHTALKNRFLQYNDEKTGLVLTMSTEALTTVQRETYHKQIRDWAMEFHNCRIPLPEEYDTEEKFINNGGEKAVAAYVTEEPQPEDIPF